MAGSAPWAERLSWAATAHRKFMNGLEPEIRRAAFSSLEPEADAALYGQTQVGKATLLLHLLGVRPDLVEAVGETLRAGRPQGMSSTPTATRYRRADGDAWTVRVGNEKLERLGREALQERIRGIRTEVEAGRWPLELVVEVGIPRSCFTTDSGRSVRIIDLPGVDVAKSGSAGRNEDAHARKLLDYWVTLADMILLVTRIGGLGPLQPDQLGVEALRYWPQQLDKFRIVLTYAFIDGSTQDWLQNAHPAERTLHELRRDIRPELDKGKPIAGLDQRELTWMYPLDFGLSWQGVPNPREYGAEALRDESLERLRRDLQNSIRPESRLRRAFRTRDLALETQVARKAGLDSMVSAAVDRVGWEVEVQHQQRDLIRRHTAAQERAVAVRADVERLWQQWRPLVRPGLPVAAAEVPGFRRLLADAASTSWTSWQQAETRLHRLIRATGAVVKPLPSAARLAADVDEGSRGAFADVLIKADRIRTFLLGKVFSGYRESLEAEVTEAGSRAAAAAERLVQAAVSRRMTDIRAAVDTSVAAARQGVADAEASLTAAVEAEWTARRRVQLAEQTRTEQLATMAEHVEVAGRFPMYLDTEYRARHAELLLAVNNARDDISQLSAAIAALEVARTYDAIRSGDPDRS
jgi:hypothetical protein